MVHKLDVIMLVVSSREFREKQAEYMDMAGSFGKTDPIIPQLN